LGKNGRKRKILRYGGLKPQKCFKEIINSKIITQNIIVYTNKGDASPLEGSATTPPLSIPKSFQ